MYVTTSWTRVPKTTPQSTVPSRQRTDIKIIHEGIKDFCSLNYKPFHTRLLYQNLTNYFPSPKTVTKGLYHKTTNGLTNINHGGGKFIYPRIATNKIPFRDNGFPCTIWIELLTYFPLFKYLMTRKQWKPTISGVNVIPSLVAWDDCSILFSWRCLPLLNSMSSNVFVIADAIIETAAFIYDQSTLGIKNQRYRVIDGLMRQKFAMMSWFKWCGVAFWTGLRKRMRGTKFDLILLLGIK